MRRLLVLVLVLALALALGACARSEDAKPVVEFGVPFGGDIQDRPTIALEPGLEALALRVRFEAPLTRETLVSWELERPTQLRTPDGKVAYAAEVGERRARPGERRIDAKLRLRKAEPPGNWRIRVRIDERLALDRSFRVVR